MQVSIRSILRRLLLVRHFRSLRANLLNREPPSHAALDAYRAKTAVNEMPRVDKGTQLLLMFKYRDMARQGEPPLELRDVEFHYSSQNGEDGILLYIFSLIGTTNRRCVELCAGEGIECNTSNLIINHGWQGLMFDGSAENIERGQEYYANRRDGLVWFPPVFAHEWITRENVNNLISRHGFAGEIDLFSLDIDGNDYWIWKAIDVIQPRVVVAEINQAMGNRRAVTIPYQEDFIFRLEEPCGASLPALVKLGKSKGYRLVGIDSFAINAVVVRNGIGEDLLPEVAAEAVAFRGRPDPNLAGWSLVEV